MGVSPAIPPGVRGSARQQRSVGPDDNLLKCKSTLQSNYALDRADERFNYILQGTEAEITPLTPLNMKFYEELNEAQRNSVIIQSD